MSRDDGFPVADVDSAYFDDAKMRELWQRIADPDRMARAVTLHSATLLSSWRHGERVTVGQAAPLWLLADELTVADLKAVRMLDRAGKIPLGSWTRWFGAAFQRREARREIGRAGGLASGKSRSTVSEASVEPRFKRDSTASEPVRPSVPSVPSVRPSGRPTTRAAREKDGPKDERPTTREAALLWLSEEYKAGRMDELDYQRQRKALGAA